MNSRSKGHQLPAWPPQPNGRNLEDNFDIQSIANELVKRNTIDPRQIRRFAKSAKQLLGMRLQ